MRDIISPILAKAGITINGNKPYDIQINDERVFKRILWDRHLGAGESYMDGWWDCERLDEMVARLLKVNGGNEFNNPLINFLRSILYSITNQQNYYKSKKVAEIHYNVGNQLYEYMLGETMAYTCAYWKNAEDLDSAQYHKFDLVCRKLGLKSGQKILELGCGFGGFANYAAKHYGVEVVAVNISTQQIKFAKENMAQDLPITFNLVDYRDVAKYNPSNIKFDHVVSIGLCEHIGFKNYKRFFKIARDQMKPEGLFLLHTIGSHISVKTTNSWIQKYIFPNSLLPSIAQLSKACEGLFVIEDLENFGVYYDKTLMAWDENFRHNWDKIKSDYSEKFYRMWRYYLMISAGGFRSRSLQLWQFVLSPNGVVNGYQSIR